LGEDQPVFAFQARGADGREAPHRRVADMAAEYIEAMRRTQPSGPYYLAGMCAGGIVAHEMARRLSEDGHEVAALALIDPLMPRTEFAWPARLRKLATLAMTRLPIATRWARKSLRRAQRKVMRRGVEGRNLLDIEDPSRVDAAVRVAIDFRIAALRFKPGVYPGPAYVLASRERIERDWRKGVWHRALPGEVRLHELGGVHDDLFDPINKQTAERLRHCLDEARAKTVP
jgi:thioesterase domain-containing protein